MSSEESHSFCGRPSNISKSIWENIFPKKWKKETCVAYQYFLIGVQLDFFVVSMFKPFSAPSSLSAVSSLCGEEGELVQKRLQQDFSVMSTRPRPPQGNFRGCDYRKSYGKSILFLILKETKIKSPTKVSLSFRSFDLFLALLLSVLPMSFCRQ